MGKFEKAISRSVVVIFILTKLSLAFGILLYQSSLAWSLELSTGGKNEQNPSSAHIFDSLSTTASGRKEGQMDLTAVSSPGDALGMAARRAPAGPQFLQGNVRFSPLAQESCPGFTASVTPSSQRGRRAGAVPSCEQGIKMAICIEQKAF